MAKMSFFNVADGRKEEWEKENDTRITNILTEEK